MPSQPMFFAHSDEADEVWLSETAREYAMVGQCASDDAAWDFADWYCDQFAEAFEAGELVPEFRSQWHRWQETTR